MKHLITFILAALLPAAAALAQTGTWSGAIELQGYKLTLVFHIGGDAPTLDVPDQGAKGIPLEVGSGATGMLKITAPSIGAYFEGIALGDKAIAGTFHQSGVSLPLKLTPGAPVINRPQTPVPPFPYQTEEVTFANGDAVLSGTLSLPEGCSRKTPVLLMVTGSGLQNSDEEIFSHKPFAVIADALAREGIATLRYDDRGFGESTGDAINCTTEDLKNDALAGTEFLRSRFDRVGVLGHSEGGTIALMLAEDGQADFVVSLAGMVVSGAETLLAQNRRALTQAGVGESEVNAYCALLSEAFAAAAASQPLPSGKDASLPPALLQNYTAVRSQLEQPYMRYFVGLDVSKRLADIKCPVLAISGELDTQVDCSRNLSALQSGLTANPSTLFRPIPSLNHLFQHCTTGDISEYSRIEETFAPEVISEIIGWVLALEK